MNAREKELRFNRLSEEWQNEMGELKHDESQISSAVGEEKRRMVGTFREYWVLSSFLPEFLGNRIFLGLLTTPIVFGPGRQFFVNS